MSKRKRPAGNQGPRLWQPMTPAKAGIPPETATLAQDDPAVAAMLAEVSEVWGNDRYTVIVQRFTDSGEVMSLSIHRNDRGAVHDWRHMQLIKNDIAGPETEAFELYPAESRLVDTANQFWLWCMPPGVRIPAGFTARAVENHDPRFPRSRQRPLPGLVKDEEKHEDS